MSEAAFAEIAERKADIVRLTMLLRRSGDSVRHSRGSNSDMGMFYNHQNLVSETRVTKVNFREVLSMSFMSVESSSIPRR